MTSSRRVWAARRVVWMVLLVTPLLSAAVFAASGSAPGAAAPASSGIRWQPGLEAALINARSTGRPVMIDFWAQWCTWCHELDVSTYADPRVLKAVQAFVAVKVNTEGNRTELRASERYGIESLPTIIFVTPNGRMFYRVEGFKDADAFVETLASVQEMSSDVLAWDQALSRDPNDPEALGGLGAHLFDQEIFEDGRELLRRAMMKDAPRPAPERKHTRTLLSILETHDRKYGEAERLLKEGLAITPADPSEDATALFALGKIYAKWGKPQQARDALKKALDTQPDGPLAASAKEALTELGK